MVPLALEKPALRAAGIKEIKNTVSLFTGKRYFFVRKNEKQGKERRREMRSGRRKEGKKIGSDIRKYPSRKTAADPAIRSKIERKVSRQDSSPFFHVITF